MYLILFTYYLLILFALLADYEVITELCQSLKEQQICVTLIVKSVHVISKARQQVVLKCLLGTQYAVSQLISMWLNYQIGPLIFTAVT